MQAVAPAPPRQDASRELVHDVDVIVLHHIVHIFFVQAVGTQQLVNVMYPLAANHEIGLKLLAAFGAFFRAQRLIPVEC